MTLLPFTVTSQEPTISPPTLGSNVNHTIQELALSPRRCALNFFGLPRAFKRLVLPSMIANVINPNIHYDCDYFVHFFNITFEAPSRSGKGGYVTPEDVYLLRDAVHNAAIQAGRPLPHVGFMLDTSETFGQKHGSLLQAIRKNETGEKNPYYGDEQTYTVETYVNIIKMWYSISAAWDGMAMHASSQNIKYERVAMMRSDVVYLTPIDVFRSAPGRAFDKFNNHSVIPGFSLWPVNDRMFYGPYEATKIWATGRFPRLDDYVYRKRRALHSEQFLDAVILPAIRKTAIPVDQDPSICFLRARPDGSVWNDCGGLSNKDLLEKLVKLKCTTYQDAVGGTVFKCPIT